ncbi:unnamed protein product [Ectocarpus sp. 4 AP-2014]
MNFSLNLVVLAFALLAGSASSFVLTPKTAPSSLASSPTSSASCSKTSLRASMDGENLLPNAAEIMDEMAGEAKGVIESLVKENKVMLFMKGNKMFPQCGFSNSAVQVLRACDVEFETYDVLTNPGVRESVKEYSSWPTIPQLYIDGEFTGGADIMIESFQSGELKKTLEDAGCTFVPSE